MELARVRRIDDARYQRAVEETKAWQGALQLAKYAEALRSRLPELEPTERERIEARCRWLEDCARLSNPVQATSLIVGFDDERDGPGW